MELIVKSDKPYFLLNIFKEYASSTLVEKSVLISSQPYSLIQFSNLLIIK